MIELLEDETPIPVLTAVSGVLEPELARAVEEDPRTTLARRCADLAELLATAQAGRGRVAVVSARLPGFDADAVWRLRGSGARVVALVDAPDDRESRARALGVDAVATAPTGDRSGIGTLLETIIETAMEPTPERAHRGDEGWIGGRARRTSDEPPVRGPGTAALVGSGEGVSEGGGSAPGLLITSWGAAGAPGRTTVAVELAAELAGAGRHVVLVDADTYAASVANHLGVLDEAAGLVSAVRAGLDGRLTPTAMQRLVPEVLPRLRLVTGITRSARWPEVRPAGFDAVLRACRAIADVVVVDVAAPIDRDDDVVSDVAAPRRNAATLLALSRADAVLAVGAADPVGLQRLLSALQEYQAAGPAGPVPVVVVTKVRQDSVGSGPDRRIRQALARFAAVHDPLLIPWDPVALDTALLSGRTLAEVAPTSPVRPPIRRLAAALTGWPLAPEPRPRRVKAAGRVRVA